MKTDVLMPMSASTPDPSLRSRFRLKRPQQLALLLLFLFFLQCCWILRHQTLSERDYEFARCGREMWEKPSPLAGYFTSCGNIQDGTLGYRVAGLPLTLQRMVAGESSEVSTWEMRHQLRYVLLLEHGGFVLAGLLLGGVLWWVTRRLFGNTGGFIALAFYCFSPPVLHASTYPNNEILTALGLFAAIYTAIGAAHAMQGPPGRGRSRLVLLVLAFGWTAAAHIAAAILALIAAIAYMGYLAVGRRSRIIPVMLMTALGMLLLVFASYAFSPDAYSYFFRSGAGRMWFSLAPVKYWFLNLRHAGLAIAAAAAVVLYLFQRRSRYFGNTAPLLLVLLLFPLYTTEISSEPTLWALPFLLVFIAGVFADAIEQRFRYVFLAATAALLLMQAALSLASLPHWAG